MSNVGLHFHSFTFFLFTVRYSCATFSFFMQNFILTCSLLFWFLIFTSFIFIGFILFLFSFQSYYTYDVYILGKTFLSKNTYIYIFIRKVPAKYQLPKLKNFLFQLFLNEMKIQQCTRKNKFSYISYTFFKDFAF